MAVKIKPLGDRVLVKAIEEKEKIRGGIIIPDTVREELIEAKVIALGTGKEDDKPFFVKVGDTILFTEYKGTKINIGDGNYVLLSEKDIFCVIAK